MRTRKRNEKEKKKKSGGGGRGGRAAARGAKLKKKGIRVVALGLEVPLLHVAVREGTRADGQRRQSERVRCFGS